MTEQNGKACLACRRGENETPLICIDYQGQRTWICPEHMPVLIHNPTDLVGRLSGAEKMKPAEHED